MIKRCITISLLLVIICVSSIVYAYNPMPVYDTYQSPSITLTNSTMNSTWWDNVCVAASNWNATPTRALISTATSGGHIVYAGSYSWSGYGVYIPLTHSSTQTTSFKIQLNSKNINSVATNFDNFVQSTMTHELGHALGINDRSGSTYIMGSSRDRNSLTTPQTDDINGVNAMWP